MKRGRVGTGRGQSDHLAFRVCGLVWHGHDRAAVIEKSDSVKDGGGIGGVGAVEEFLEIRHPVTVEVPRGGSASGCQNRPVARSPACRSPANQSSRLLGVLANGAGAVGNDDRIRSLIIGADIREQEGVGRGA